MNRDIKTITDGQAVDNMVVVKEAKTLERVNREITELYHYTYKKSYSIFRKSFNSILNEFQDQHHDSWEKALTNRNSYKPRGNVFNWFYTILKNNTLNLLKSSYHQTTVKLDDKSDSEDGLAFVSDKNSALTIKSNYSNMDIEVLFYNKLIKDAVANYLSVQEQELFRLYFIEDKITADIAKEMNIGNATVDRLKKAVLDKLKYYLN